MKYYIIDLNYSADIGYTVFVTDCKMVMDEYQYILKLIEGSIEHTPENLANSYIRKLMWIVSGPESDKIFRVIVPDGDFGTIHDAIVQFFTDKYERSKGEGN